MPLTTPDVNQEIIILKDLQAATDFLKNPEANQPLNTQAFEFCLVILSKDSKGERINTLLEETSHQANEEKWTRIEVVEDRVRAFLFNGRLLPTEQAFWDGIRQIQRPASLSINQIATLGAFCVAQNDAEIKLKGLAWLHHAAQSPKKGGDRAREDLQRILDTQNWISGIDGRAKTHAQKEIKQFIKTLHKPYMLYRSYLEKTIPLDRCINSIIVLGNKIEQFTAQKGSPQEILWLGTTPDTSICIKAMEVKRLRQLLAAPTTNDPQSIEAYDAALKALQTAAADLVSSLDLLLVNTQTKALWSEEVPELKQLFESDLQQLGDQAQTLSLTVDSILNQKSTARLAFARVMALMNGCANTQKNTAMQLILNALYHTQDDQLVMTLHAHFDPKSKQSQARPAIGSYEADPLGFLAVHAASAKRFNLLKLLIPMLLKSQSKKTSITQRVTTHRQAEETEAQKQKGMSIIEIAAYEGQAEIVKTLLCAGAPMEDALFWAHKQGHKPVIHSLLASWLPLQKNQVNWVCPRSGNTLLDYASLGALDESGKFFLALKEMRSRQNQDGNNFKKLAPIVQSKEKPEMVFIILQKLQSGTHLKSNETALLINIMTQWITKLQSPQYNEVLPFPNQSLDPWQMNLTINQNIYRALRRPARELGDLAKNMRFATKEQEQKLTADGILFFILFDAEKSDSDQEGNLLHDYDLKLLLLISHWCEGMLNQPLDTTRWMNIITDVSMIESTLAQANLPLEQLPLVQKALIKILTSCLLSLQLPLEDLEEKHAASEAIPSLAVQLKELSLYHLLLTRSPLSIAQAIQKKELTIDLESVKMAILLNGGIPKSKGYFSYCLDATLVLLISHWHENQLSSGQAPGKNTLEGITALNEALMKIEITQEESPNVQTLLTEIASYANNTPAPASRLSKTILLLSPNKEVAEIEEAVRSGELSASLREIELAQLLHTGNDSWGNKHYQAFETIALLLLSRWYADQLNQPDLNSLHDTIKHIELFKSKFIDKSIITMDIKKPIVTLVTSIRLDLLAEKMRLQEALEAPEEKISLSESQFEDSELNDRLNSKTFSCLLGMMELHYFNKTMNASDPVFTTFDEESTPFDKWRQLEESHELIEKIKASNRLLTPTITDEEIQILATLMQFRNGNELANYIAVCKRAHHHINLAAIKWFIHVREANTPINRWESFHYYRIDDFIPLLISQWHKNQMAHSSRWWESAEHNIAAIMNEIKRRGIPLIRLPRLGAELMKILEAAAKESHKTAYAVENVDNEDKSPSKASTLTNGSRHLLMPPSSPPQTVEDGCPDLAKSYAPN